MFKHFIFSSGSSTHISIVSFELLDDGQLNNYYNIVLYANNKHQNSMYLMEFILFFPYDQNHFVFKNKQNIWKTKQMVFKWSLKGEGHTLTKKPQNPTNPSTAFTIKLKATKMLAMQSNQFRLSLLEVENLPTHIENLHFKMKHKILLYLFEMRINPSGACKIYAHCLMTF